MQKFLLATVCGLCFAGGAAHATLVGGPVPAAVATTFGGSTVYTYQSMDSSNNMTFAVSGGGTLSLASSLANNTFGYASATGTNQTVVFSNGQAVGTTATIAPSFTPFTFYFQTGGVGATASSPTCNPASGDDCAATLFTVNKLNQGAAGGNDGGQADLAIYYAAATNTYAFFFDDGGAPGLTNGVPNDDNDYNDLAVTFTPNAVPEPMSLSLLGGGLAALGLLKRSKRKSSI